VSETTNGRAAGGAARAKKLTASQRSAIAKKAAAARWEPVPEAVCGSPDQPLRIGNLIIECYVLEDGTRVITQRSFLRALGRNKNFRRFDPDETVPPMLQGKTLKPYLSEELIERGKPIPFMTQTARALGYRAEFLPDVCEAYLAARKDGVLPPNQLHVADQAEILVRGLARVGIIALVDEATGYQELRTKSALEKILAEFIDKELQVYLPTFPPDFYKEMFRLRGLEYSTETVSRRPKYFGTLTNDVVYKRLAPGVLEELKKVQEKTPAGNAKHKLFQRLTQNIGYPKLREHLGSVVTLMKLSTDWESFKANLEMVHPMPKPDGQEMLDLPMSLPATRGRAAGERRDH
jgi:hypothetical protein